MSLFIFSLNLIISISFLSMKHPLSMGLMLLIQTILVSIICGFMSNSFWFAYILFLVMIGGMLVLFIYMTSLASNELFNFSLNNFLFFVFIWMNSMIFIFFLDKNFLFLINQDMNIFNETINITLNFENQFNLTKLYNNPTMNLTIMLINYLLLCLIIVINITKKNFGPLRSNF
uniref:NADH-ubiquinone oxidoreductase chain 6 n=1 Tax=Thyridosmylus langii TaxID=1305651 RepID=R9QZV2_9NEOP|nr:NADH dehydrogenase subunit 6 [Thyridosmylus langii]AGH27226.1 NADH dehydrogenase subunit 6 [Thyridosmylus langii]